jgi:uncharacterized protein
LASSEWLIPTALFGVALVAGFVDAIAGGGGLLTIPALMMSGIPAHSVFGTNKGSAVFGSGSALYKFFRSNMVDTSRAPFHFAAGFAGSLLGAALLLSLSSTVLKPLVLVLLMSAGLGVLSMKAPLSAKPARPVWVTTLVCASLGAYDGFFGPGTGTFLIAAFSRWWALSLEKASANAKVVNFASNLAAVLLLAFRGTVVWKLALPMAVGQFIGGNIGARVTIKFGPELVRRAVVLVVCVLVVKLGFDVVNARAP